MTSERGVNLPIGYKLSEVGAIPEDWATRTFAEQFNISAGGDVDLVRFSEFADARHPYPIYSNSLDQKGLYGYSSYSAHPSESLTVTARGTLGVATYRDHPYTAIGRVLVLQPRQESAGVFFENFINSRVKFAIESTGVPQLTAPQIGAYTVAVPELAEQRAIAEALSDVDALLAGLDRLIAKKRDLRQAAIQQLITGQTRLPGFHDPWESKRLGEIGTFLKGSGVRKDEANSGDRPCIRYGEIYTHHHNCIKEFSSWISAEVASAACRLKQGDLLFAGSGETKEEIGKCVAYLYSAEAYAGGDIVILRPFGVDAAFMGYYCNTSSINAQKASKGQGDAVVHISAAALSSIEVALPTVAEQNAIATVLLDMDAELAALEDRRAKTRALKQAMMQELLTGRIRLI